MQTQPIGRNLIRIFAPSLHALFFAGGRRTVVAGFYAEENPQHAEGLNFANYSDQNAIAAAAAISATIGP